MRFFDAHCDTIMKVREGKGDFAVGGMHVTLPGMLESGTAAQVFAAFVTSEQKPGEEFETAMSMLEGIRGLCRDNPAHLVHATEWPAIAGAFDVEGRVAVIMGVEGAAPLQGSLENLHDFHRAGVRILTIAWADSPFCGSTFGEGGGLTALGRDLIDSCRDLGIVIDVSHASDAAFWDVVGMLDGPFVASHSNCRSLCSFPRNLTDDMIRSLADRGGVMGLNLGSGFLSEEFHAREQAAMDEFFRVTKSGEKTFDEAFEVVEASTAQIPRPALEVIVAHVTHAMKVGGEDCVGLGGDLDGVASTPEGIEGVQDYPKIASLLKAAGLSDAQVEKVCWRNMARVFAHVMGEDV